MASVGLDKADYLAPFLCFLQESTAMEGIRKERGGCSPSQAGDRASQSISVALKRELFR